MSAYRLRRAAAADADHVVSWFPTRESALLWGGGNVPEPLTAAWLEAAFGCGRYYVLVDQAGVVCGTFSIGKRDGGRAHIGRFGIAPALRRRGLGTQMLTAAIDMARKEGANKVTLLVYERNHAARNLYTSVGFIPSEEPDPNRTHDMIMMEWPIL